MVLCKYTLPLVSFIFFNTGKVAKSVDNTGLSITTLNNGRLKFKVLITKPPKKRIKLSAVEQTNRLMLLDDEGNAKNKSVR